MATQLSKEDAKALFSDQQLQTEIIQSIEQGSTILPQMRKLPNMTSDQSYVPVADALPMTYWVDEDTNNGRKQTTNAQWKNVKLYASELAVVVPVKINTVRDANYDIIGNIKPLIVQSAYKRVDEAIIMGKDKPALWREGIVASAINAGNVIAPASNNTYTQISDAMAKVEEDGYDVTAILGGVALKGEFRKGLLDTTGQPLANSDVTELPRIYAKNGAWDSAKAKFVVGDFTQAVYSIREDVTFDVFTEGCVTDNEGKVIYNLMQDDMMAIRFTFRMGWALPNPVNVLNEDESTRFPFAVVEPTTAPTTYTLTVTVKDNAETPKEISGAVVTVGSQVKKTGTNGQAVFKSLGNEKYLYEVTANGKKSVYGKVSVASTNGTLAVTMVAKD